tara:strand:- start:825 stop:1706 length:882 start_codon:yes stop_codon:yes gene_type:complete
MARKYSETFTIPLGTPSDPNEYVFQRYLDVAKMASQRLQKNIRQGRVFHLHNVKTQLIAPSSGNLDQGVSLVGRLMWAPATRNSVKAWQEAFKTWMAQKKLSINAVGSNVRYDDFEVAYSSNGVDARTSALYASGNTDTDLESVAIYGSSVSGDVVTLEDIYESAQDQAPPSRFPLSNTVVKESKFTSEFPNPQTVPHSASWSAIHVDGASFDTGAQVQSGDVDILDGASLCGVLYMDGKMLPENTTFHIQDELYLMVTLTYSIGRSLVRRKAKKGGKSRGRRTTKRTYRKRG